MLVGIFTLALSQLLFLLVRKEWHLAVPAIASGCRRRFSSLPLPLPEVSPSLRNTAAWEPPRSWPPWMSACSSASRRRASCCIAARQLGLPPYPTMFIATAAMLAVVGIWRTADASTAPN